MLDRIIQFSLKNRLLVLLSTMVLIVCGLYSAFHAEVDVFPDLNAPTVVVMTEAQGMAVLIKIHAISSLALNISDR